MNEADGRTPPPRPDAATPLTVLRGLREVTATEDVRTVLDRGLDLAGRVTGARAGVLALVEDDRESTPVGVLPWGLATEDDVLARALSRPDPAVREDEHVLTSPVHTGRRTYGVLRLALGHDPTHEDQALVDTVAGVVGSRVDALQQRTVSRLHERVIEAAWEVDRTLVEEVDLERTLPLLVDRLTSLARARAVAVVGRTEDGHPRVLAAGGPEAATVVAELRTDIEACLADGRPVHWSESQDEHSPSPDDDAGPGSSTGPVRARTSVLPVDVRGETAVALVVAGWRAADDATEHQLRDVLAAQALRVSFVLERALADHEHDLLTVLEDRDRIARDLHDLVIQRLFAVGLTLQGASRHAADPQLADRLSGAVSELDQTIRDIRATIFQLRRRPGASSFRAEVRQLVESYAATLGFAPLLRMDGPLDTVTDDEVASQVLMVVREGLSNVARHAGAGSVTVHLRARGGRLELTVVDDGIGIAPGRAESGLANVRARAQERGGEVRLAPARPRGTRLSWVVPL